MRKIIHIDCDCFYAAVEMRDNPTLRDVPLAIGGSSKRRGVLATCNYPARSFGLHSAMATKEAFRLCPELVLLPARFEAYREASRQVRDIFYRYTDLVEPLSLDEAYLDVTNSERCGGIATEIAKEICTLIEQEVGISASAGIAENKFLAKVASDWQKPSGITVIKPSQVERFIKQLPVKKIPGVGKAAMKKMQLLAINNGEDLQQVELSVLVQHFGVFGKRLYDLARGEDLRPVSTQRVRKSLSVEHTFSEDLQSLDDVQQAIEKVYAEFVERLNKALQKEEAQEGVQEGLQESDQESGQQSASKKIHKCFVKVKFADFTQTTKEMSDIDETQIPTLEQFKTLSSIAFSRKAKPVRLIGVGVGFKADQQSKQQLALFE
jgi:DNA polymerase-4